MLPILRLIVPLFVFLPAMSTIDAAPKQHHEVKPLCIPVDQRVWRPLDNLLPSDQTVVHFVPDPAEKRWLLGEHITIERGPIGSKVRDMSIGAPDSEVIKAVEKPNHEMTVVLKDKKDGRFSVIRTLQGPDAAYTVAYVGSEKGLSPSELCQWHDRIENMKFGKHHVGANCLLLSAKKVYRDGEEVKAAEGWSRYEHSTRPFSCSLPSSWIAAEVCNEQKASLRGPAWTEYLGFTRSDELVFGGISSVITGRSSPEEIDRDFATALNYVHGRNGFEVIEHGDFPTETGGKGKYLLVKDKGHFCAKRFHYCEDRSYKIEVWVHERDYPVLKDTLLRVMNGFEVSVRSDSSPS